MVRTYVDHGSNRVSEILSTGTLYAGLSWSRSTTTLTITSTGHGLTTGDYVVIRNMSEDYLFASVTVSDANTFTVTCANSGGASGTAGAYIPVPVVNTGATLNDDEMTIVSPSAGTVQIVSVKITTGTKSGTTFILKMPTSLTNGAGADTSILNQNPPLVGLYNLSSGAFVTAGVGSVQTSSNFNFFQVGGCVGAINNMIRFTF